MKIICYECREDIKNDGKKLPVIYSQCRKCEEKEGEKSEDETLGNIG